MSGEPNHHRHHPPPNHHRHHPPPNHQRHHHPPPNHQPPTQSQPQSQQQQQPQPQQQPPPPPPQPQPPPYTYLPSPPHRRSINGSRKRSSNCASCILATFFLLTVAVIAVVACFVLFRPQDPKIAVNSVRFPAFSLANGTVDFTFFQYVAVSNPNRYSFSHYDSSLQLFYSGSQLGFMFIPAGEIDAGRTQYVSATFNVRSIPVAAGGVGGGGMGAVTAAVSGGGGGIGVGVGVGGMEPTMEVETRMKMVGRVRVFKVFSHRVESNARCRVTIEVSNGNVLGFHC